MSTHCPLCDAVAVVVSLLSSSAVNANPIRQSVCPPGEYFDGIGKKCVKCSLICRPDLPQDFCQNNCRGYLSSTTMTLREEAPRVQAVLMMTTLQPSTPAVPGARQQSILPPNNDAAASATSPSTLEVVIIAVVCVSAVAILVVVVIVIVVVVILYRMKVTPTSQDTKTKEPTDQANNNGTTAAEDDYVQKFGHYRSPHSSVSTNESSDSYTSLLNHKQ